MSLLPAPSSPSSWTDDAAANAARKHIAAKSRRFVSLPSLKSRSHPIAPTSSMQHLAKPVTSPSSPISLDSTSLDKSHSFTDKYKWAIVYENQRGITLFSIPYYSRRSLLPFDPPPFTVPNVSSSSKQASVSLEDYPLPDGTWKWVSKCWMIDMRSDTGEVQHDGFEYNSVFRAHKWSAEVGSFSAGGWVRRRRWIRLMMRPARPQNLRDHEPEGQSTSSVSTRTVLYHPSSASSSFPRLIKYPQSDVRNLVDIDSGWLKEDVEGNWQKCRSLMRYLGRDGRKLDLWKLWLAPDLPERPSSQLDEMSKGKTRQSDMAADGSTGFADVPEQLQTPPDIIPILRLHGNELLHTFVYPESRANFMTMLVKAGLLHALETGMGFTPRGMDFWSYIDGVAEH